MLKRVFVVGFCIALLGAGTASALRIEFGNLVMNIDGGFTPTTLPKNRNAPINIEGSAKIRTKDGSHPSPLRKLTIEYDKHGHLETRGLPVCSIPRIANTTVAAARKNCPGAIVGRGFGRAVVKFPDQNPIPAASPITIFNGPRKGGDATVIAHAYLTIPVPTTYIVPIRIQKIKKGRYGYRTEARIPQIAGGNGSATGGKIKIGRRWTARIGGKKRKLSYLNARCVGGRLQARGFFEFQDGSKLNGSLFRPCKVRR